MVERQHVPPNFLLSRAHLMVQAKSPMVDIIIFIMVSYIICRNWGHGRMLRGSYRC